VKVSGRTVLIGALGLAILVAFIVFGASSADSPEHRTDSDAANGASALPQLAQALGRPAAILDTSFQPDLGMSVLFVLTPTVGFSTEEARRLADYVAGGGALVYAAEQGDPRLDFTLKVNRLRGQVGGEATGTGPALAGVSNVSGSDTVGPLQPSPGQVVLLRGARGVPVAFEQFVGRGRVVVLADPLPLCNGYLEKADNWRLAADLISLAPAGARVGFDEYHHGAAGQGSAVSGLLSTAWGSAIVWAVVVVFVGLFLRGRAFGPRLALPGGGARSSAEYVSAVGGLLQRSRGWEVTGRLLAAATRRALAARHGLAVGPAFEASLQGRAPMAVAELQAADRELESAGGDGGLLKGARRLHALAYPGRPRQ
jgi:uncharacterized protein DUF4350